MARVAVFVSGGGTNLQALIDAAHENLLPNAHLSLVVASNDEAYALKRAEEAGIKSEVVNRKNYESANEFDEALKNVCKDNEIDLVVLAGFLSVLGKSFISAFKNRIINVHPSLIPAFCGKGFYGLKVHEAALIRGVKVSGASVHIVNEVCDGGPILAQKAVEVVDGDTPETLQRRVMEKAEWILLPRVVQECCKKLDEGLNIV